MPDASFAERMRARFPETTTIPRAYTLPEAIRIVALHRAGRTWRQIGAEMGRSVSSLSHHFAGFVQSRAEGPQKWHGRRLALAQRMMDALEDDATIGARLGISANAIAKAVQRGHLVRAGA